MKMRIVGAVSSLFLLLLLLSVSFPASAAINDMKEKNFDVHAGKSGLSYHPNSFTGSQVYSASTECERIGLINQDIAKYKIKVRVGPGRYDSITLTNYVREKSPWQTDAKENLVILPGQGLTEKFYSDMAVYYAQQGYCAYILDRRETNVPSDETNYDFMKKWTVGKHLKDTYEGIAASRVHTAFISGESAENIKVTAVGHSHGALLITAYEASNYDDVAKGAVDRVVPVDIIIKYNPAEQGLIQGQAQAFNEIHASIQSGTYYADNMGTMMGLAFLAATDPGNSSSMQGLTNLQLFRFVATQTYACSKYPYTPDYHYWSGDLNGLYNTDETRLLSLTLGGGAVPYTPKYIDEYMAGLMGNIQGYEINPSKVDSPVLYVGLGGGFGTYGAWWFENKVANTNSNVSAIKWSDQGHASLLIDRNSPEVWARIDNWIRKQ
jgi:hypothetical protein